MLHTVSDDEPKDQMSRIDLMKKNLETREEEKVVAVVAAAADVADAVGVVDASDDEGDAVLVPYVVVDVGTDLEKS